MRNKYLLSKLERHFGHTQGIEARTTSKNFGAPVAGKGGKTTNSAIPEKKEKHPEETAEGEE